MPYVHMREIRTPLRLMGVRFFRDADTRVLYIKVGRRHRRRLTWWPRSV